MHVKDDGYGDSPEAVDYWIQNRSHLIDLYPSEKYFFLPAISEAKKVLDIGCAAGGGAFFTREANPEIEYIGIDNSSELIRAATSRTNHLPKTQFIHFNGIQIPLENNVVDFCFSFGVFHHLNHWQQMVEEALRVTADKLLFDIRLWNQNTLINNEISYQKLAVGSSWDNESIIPYNIIGNNAFMELAHTWNSKGIDCKAYGYYQKPTHLAITPAKEVLMLSVLLSKNSSNPITTIQII